MIILGIILVAVIMGVVDIVVAFALAVIDELGATALLAML